MGPNGSNGNQNSKIQSFLENLRASRANQNGSNNNQETKANNPFKEFQAKKEIEQRRVELFHQARQQEFVKVYSARDKEKEQKIENIRQQLKQLSASLKILNKNIARAIETVSPNPSVHEESFLEHIYKQINLLQKSANSTNTWLEVFASRSKKKGFYSSMAKSRGSAYTQSNERVVATSVG